MGDLEHSPGWHAVNRALWLLGTAVVAAQGVALLLFGSDFRATTDEAARQQMQAEHEIVCDQLDIQQGAPARERCLSLLLQLQHRHEQAYAAQMASQF